MRLSPILDPELTLILRGVRSRDDALRTIAETASGRSTAVEPGRLLDGFIEREAKYPTGTPEGVAFPHVLLPELSPAAVVVALLRPGVGWGGPAGLPAQDMVFAILGNEETPWEHVRLLARLARIIRGEGVLDRLRAARAPTDLHAALTSEDERRG